MEGIQTQAMPYGTSGIYNTNPGVTVPQMQTTSPNTEVKNGKSKLETALKCLAIAAAAGVAIYGGAKAVQYLKAGHTPQELATAVGDKAKSLAEQAGNKLKNLGKKTAPVHTGEKLPLFDPKNVKPGRYADGAGNLVVIDNYGTSIIDFGQNRFLVNHGTTQKLYDGAFEMAKRENVTGAVKDIVQKADLALIAPKTTQAAKAAPRLGLPAGSEIKALAAPASAEAQKAIPLPPGPAPTNKAIALRESSLFARKALPAGNSTNASDVIALPASIEEARKAIALPDKLPSAA